MNGTILVETVEIDWMPPKITTATSMAITSPDNCSEICKLCLREDVIAFTCVNVPVPNRATKIPLMEKNFASGNHLSLYFCNFFQFQ